ncbi:MAG: hypothetical protein GC201_11015 [Alphaproteobacteria bacterium]|nr:hypothetical protein [Alphaproteobacteria bacterium]
MLSELDETLMHQGPVTFDHALTSDHRFFDRMFVGGHCADNVKFITGMAAYKNMNAFDGFLCVQKDGRQYNARFSRPFLPDLGNLSVGPLRVTVLEPLKRLSVSLAAPEGQPVEAELVFTGLYPAHEEAHHLRRINGRLQQDYRRFDQIGRVDGWLSVAGERIPVEDWFSVRDHSWGVRPGVGGYEPTTIIPSAAEPVSLGQLFIWLAFRTPSMAGQMQRQEDSDGRLLMQDGYILRPGPDGIRQIGVRDIAHDIEFVEGTRVYRKARLEVVLENGETLDIRAKALLSPWCYKGSGYDSGYDDEMGLGFHRGATAQYDVYDVSHPEDSVLPDGRIIQPVHREQPVTLTVNGEAGLGHLPVINWGLVKSYGLSKPPTNKRA